MISTLQGPGRAPLLRAAEQLPGVAARGRGGGAV